MVPSEILEKKELRSGQSHFELPPFTCCGLLSTLEDILCLQLISEEREEKSLPTFPINDTNLSELEGPYVAERS